MPLLLCGNVYLEKLEIGLRYQGDRSVRSDRGKKKSLEPHNFRNVDVLFLAIAEGGQHMSLAGKCSSEVPPNLIALLFLLPHSRYCVYFFFLLL